MQGRRWTANWMVGALCLSGGLSASSQPTAPQSVTYEHSWTGSAGEGVVAVEVDTHGVARLRTSWTNGQPPIVLRPGDLAAFEGKLAAAAFWDRPAIPPAGGGACLDYCSEHDFRATENGRSKISMVQGGPLGAAVNELDAIALARSGAPRATPSPWWGPATAERSAPAQPQCAADDRLCRAEAWQRVLDGLRLKTLAALPELGRAYRLVILAPMRKPAAIELTTEFRPQGRGGRRVYCLAEFFGRCDEPNIVLIRSSHRRRVQPIEDLEVIEAALAKADFATVDGDDPRPCASGVRWILEAMVGDRYRIVQGTCPDRRGLDGPLHAIAKLGAVPL